MGEMLKKRMLTGVEQREFVQHLVNDIDALESLLEKGRFEDDIVRIGAEQEICIINKEHRPAGVNLELLEKIADDHFTTELASYNIEINLDPFELKGNCFSLVEAQLVSLIDKAREKAASLKTDLIMAGILPTISKKEVDLDYLTPIPRYLALNDSLKADKGGGDFNLKIRGVDELYLKHDSVMFEACNTSFQLHLQVSSHDFIESYNWAQAIAGPVLSVCCNSPLLLGRELWKETRIALFQQSLDTRKLAYNLSRQSPRVGFGDRWEKGSVAEIFKDNISRHRVLLTKAIKGDSLEELSKGKPPQLQALRLHNGTVYRWNRPCYGISNGKPHLRIENRYIPSGPSIIDEIANFAFWVGVMKGRPKAYDDISSKMDFSAVKANFIKAARTGKETVFIWNGKSITAKNLVANELLPMAYSGLKKCNVDAKDIDRLLGIIEARIQYRTGEQWQVANYRRLKKHFRTHMALVLLTKAIHQNQKQGMPIHQWPDIDIEKELHAAPLLVKEVMITSVLRLKENDYANMALAIMEWNDIHHLPIENDHGEFIGLLTWSQIHSLSKKMDFKRTKVSSIMIKEVFTITPDSTLEDAKRTMLENNIGCLPVCIDNHLVGIVSKRDLY